MNFSVQGTTTPRSYQRHLPGSARGRPQSGKPQINPITGEEIIYAPTPRQPERPNASTINGNSNAIPSLNLNYLKDDDVSTGALDIDLKDYSLDTPGTASTVSWGTAKSGRADFKEMTKVNSAVKSTRRPEGVPGLNLGNTKPPSARRPVKQPSAWDKDPVPSDLQATPSARHLEMYKQYADEMKQSYRTKANLSHVTQKEAVENDERICSARFGGKEQEKPCEDDGPAEPGANDMSESWTRQRYSGKQLLKKKDAEDLLEQNKKQKLVETVMIDQLSRAVISDPDQDSVSTARPSSTRRARGSNRYLHNSKIKTSSTATENLLSKRVRFGARILTRDGRNAMRELTGFYFDCDRTLTVYEFRKFGKSAKAMPFIYRGQYVHKSGPKQGCPYSISDIHTGANLKIPTAGQLALTDSLSESDHIVLRVTDVDEAERQALLDESDQDDERLHAPSRLDVENKEFLYMVQDHVQDKIKRRGIKTVTGLGRYYRKLDEYNTGILDQYDLEKGLKTFHIDLDPQQLEDIFDILDPEGMKLLDYVDYMHGVLGEMNEYRKALVRKAFLKLDSMKKGNIHISDVKKFFNVNYKHRSSTGSDTSVSAIQAFFEAIRENEKQELISFIDFQEYYEGLSIGIDNDEEFANVLRNTWNI